MRDLASFTLAGYDKGRGRVVQALWFAVMNLVFMSWLCPASWRVAVLRLFGAEIGDRVVIRHRVRVLWPWKLRIGDDSWIGEGAWLLNLESDPNLTLHLKRGPARADLPATARVITDDAERRSMAPDGSTRSGWQARIRPGHRNPRTDLQYASDESRLGAARSPRPT